jgi:hypothetical protein
MREAAFDRFGKGKSGVTLGSMRAVREYGSLKRWAETEVKILSWIIVEHIHAFRLFRRTLMILIFLKGFSGFLNIAYILFIQ